MENCEIVFHTASPFTLAVNDPQKQLIDPALLGTQNVLAAVNKTECVKRVVLTSSVAAIYGDNKDLEKTPKGIFTEEIWNTTSCLEHGAYSYSKTLAEKEAWKIQEQQNRWDLVVINPSLVIGPGINPHATSESFNILRQLGDGSMKSGCPKVGIGAVDVRDLADAHMAAAFMPNAKGRHIISGHNTDFLEMAQTLHKKYGNDFPIPKKALPKWLVWLIAPLMDKTLTRKWISLNVNLPWRGDNQKSIRELKISYRSLALSMNDFFQQAIESGLIPKK
jgi:dihydroflavonol-4-reductase